MPAGDGRMPQVLISVANLYSKVSNKRSDLIRVGVDKNAKKVKRRGRHRYQISVVVYQSNFSVFISKYSVAY